MAIQTPKFDVAMSSSGQQAAPPQAHRRLRLALIALAGLVALTAIPGALFVLPTMPTEWLHQGLIAPFADYNIPALALGILCGGMALLAITGVLLRPRFGGLTSLIAGILMIGFELVEITIVGFTPLLYPTQPQGWLQVIYLVVGSLMAALGWRLWKADARATR